MNSGTVIALPSRQDADVVRPPRLTFAGRCVYCGAIDCADANCIALHEISEWAVCGHCHGTGEGFRSESKGCTCAFGLALVAPEIERRRNLPGTGLHQIDEGHWSSYNHITYGVPVVREGFTVRAGKAAA
ncbi:hypothetical protein [Nocardia terpenica]|uniref:Uncharacterized protein n=1 Tax=Nocardia terpenica TaxID=455432 RepID=A0A164MZJ4_9NOCA|nr:hypothetical protein [Nocardia terpenica]KZM73823.1 hypothetical protein AWN90_35350 [Nocardia terpenica]KZM74902.1 hypothetical protein AWN90_23070 [Nocardia terpenica]NQE86906.1 hypothetical protein [Nocardia terpenica]NQE93440.1 hypothetical protein [Nocardia terpenica]